MKTAKSTQRRNFLLAAGLGSAGVAAAIVATGRKGKKVAAAAAAPSESPSGYRASEHVLKYYKTTEV
jgi:hypothetical protein